MKDTEKQYRPCPNCCKIAGWWSNVKVSFSMVFHGPNGEVTEKRIVEANRKYCADCDSDITKCVST